MSCFTPIELPITDFIRFGSKNEILIRVGDRAWLPSQAAGGVDKEKVHYLPGIWDDVELSFTGVLRLQNVLVLPDAKEGKATLKFQVRNCHPSQERYGAKMFDKCRFEVSIYEKSTHKCVSQATVEGKVKRDNLTVVESTVAIPGVHKWSPDDPFLYYAKVSLYEKDNLCDNREFTFGMRDFGRSGKHFTLNDEKIYLRGSNITLQRFFEDPDCGALAWDREWVRKLMAELPKSVNWNAMRICVGLVPDFWYDIADEAGIMLQNEWMYWQNHGWDDQIRSEFYDWVWSDGNHPSIVIWDAINENWDDYIGNTLIPEMKRLDHTRIWDSGYMTSDQMSNDEMDEPHPYRAITLMHSKKLNDYFAKNPYDLGKLDEWTGFTQYLDAGVPQLVNEYAWIWLWRDGQPAKLTVNNYNYFLGPDATADQRRQLQAYWVQVETEWLRTERSLAGILAFCHLTNNYGFTGDWFMDNIKDLKPAPVFDWFRHAFAPTAVFVNLTDERYTKHTEPHAPGSDLVFNLVAVNDLPKDVKGSVTVRLLDAEGVEVYKDVLQCEINEYYKTNIPYSISLPEKCGGYLVTAEFIQDGLEAPVISRRYVKVGDKSTEYSFYDIKP
jgi:beta-galactosidase/beta-glucuronidase